MNTFLVPFGKALNELSSCGISWTDKGGNTRVSKVFPGPCTVDTVASKHARALTTSSEPVRWLFFAALHKFLGSLPLNDASLEEECLEDLRRDCGNSVSRGLHARGFLNQQQQRSRGFQKQPRHVSKHLYGVARQELLLLLGYPTIFAFGVVKFVGAVTPARTAALPDTTPRDVAPVPFACLGTFLDDYTIHIKPDTVQYSLNTARRIPTPLQDIVKHELDKMEQEGVIRRVDEPMDWCAGLVVVPKPARGCRLCVDLTKLKQVVLRECPILPTVDQILGLLGDVCVFSKLDATSGFHQVRLACNSQKYTTFITPFGMYCYNMGMGLAKVTVIYELL
ncbi:uncharacterized protein ISCGN_003459 [Ixodes scapularis]